MQSLPSLPTEMFFHGRAQSLAAVGGVVGAVLYESPKGPADQLREVMKVNGIDLPSILKREFFAAAAAQGTLLQAASGMEAQGELTLTINMYGFGQTQGFSALLYPVLHVTATVRKPNGEIAWQRTESALPLNAENKYGYEFERYVKEPELLTKTLTNISAIVSRMLVASLDPSK